MIYHQNENLTVFTNFTAKIVSFLLTACVRKSVRIKHQLVKPRVLIYGAVIYENGDTVSTDVHIF